MAKTYRIYRIFNNSTLTLEPTGYGDIWLITGGIFFLFTILASIICFSTGLMRPTVIQNKYIPTQQVQQCRSPNETVFYVFVAIIVACMFALLLSACVLAWKTRHVDSAYNESRYITIVVFAYLELLAIFIPLLATTSTYSGESGFTVSILIELILVWIILILVLFPKVYNIRREQSAEKRAAIKAREAEFEGRIRQVSSSSEFSDSEEEARFKELLDPRRRKIIAEEVQQTRQRDRQNTSQGVLFADAIGDLPARAPQSTVWTGPIDQ